MAYSHWERSFFSSIMVECWNHMQMIILLPCLQYVRCMYEVQTKSYICSHYVIFFRLMGPHRCKKLNQIPRKYFYKWNKIAINSSYIFYRYLFWNNSLALFSLANLWYEKILDINLHTAMNEWWKKNKIKNRKRTYFGNWCCQLSAFVFSGFLWFGIKVYSYLSYFYKRLRNSWLRLMTVDSS